MELDRKRVLDLLAAVAIAVVFVGASILYGAVGPFPWMPDGRYWVLGAFTALLFWTSVQSYRRYWRRQQFWLKTTGLLAGHWLAWTVMLRAVPEWRVIWFVPPMIVEAFVLVVLFDKLGFSPSDAA